MERKDIMDKTLSQDEIFDLLQQAEGVAPVPSEAPRRCDDDDEAPISFAQERLWLIEKIDPGLPVYNSSHAVRITGEFEIDVFRQAMTEVLRRHEVLRSTFTMKDGHLRQRTQPLAPAQVTLTDLRGLSKQEQEEATRQFMVDEHNQLFDFATGPFLRGAVARLKDREHLMVVTTHHIVSDRWSTSVLLKELGTLYATCRLGQGSPLPELPIQYRDYARWQRECLQGDAVEDAIEYWRWAIGDPEEVLELPTDYPRRADRGFDAGRETLICSSAVAGGLQQLSRRSGVTNFMTLLAAFQTLLHRYSGQASIRVGTPISGRDTVELETLIGVFVNTLVLRARFDDDPSFLQLLQQVRETVFGAFAHKDTPFERLVEKFLPPRDLASTPLFQVMFVFEERQGSADSQSSSDLEWVPTNVTSTPFDLMFIVREEAETFTCAMEYSLGLFKPETIRRMMEHWANLLASILASPETRISRLGLLTAPERAQLIAVWNDTATEFPRQACVHELFEAQAQSTPEEVATVYEGDELTYRELNRRANQMAHYLRELGVRPDSRVGICAERSLEMLVALLAVMKAGGAYVPLDPAYPVERLQWMLEDSSPAVLLTQNHLRGLFAGLRETMPILDLTDGVFPWKEQPATNPDRAAGLTPRHLAYVIYTSGSTGTPKGVMVEHRGVVNRLVWMQRAYALDLHDAVLQKTPFSFDVSVWELFWPILAGARLVIARPEGHKDPAYLIETIRQNGITVVHFVPSMLQVFLEHANVTSCSTLARVMCSGESLLVPLVKRFQECLPHVTLQNFYGPTEATVEVSVWNCPSGITQAGIPIGRPIANTQLYILDAHGEPMPVGVTGELYIGGVQVARGYLNRAELTAERFLPDGFGKEAGARVYSTGDLCRWLEDGTIEFLGRNDSQVKIRGCRIELGEVEVRLLEQPGVREAAVIAREDTAGEKRLVAYYTATEAGVSVEQMRACLRAKLPDYMVPAAYVRLEQLPLTTSGKLDRNALPLPTGEAFAARGYEPPRGETETALAGMWTALLRLDRVGRHDNFFELGGHSLLAVTLIERMRQMGMDLDVRALFATPTLAALAATIRDSKSLDVPENRIPLQCEAIAPEMLTLVELTGVEIDGIVEGVSGGARNVQDIYPLAPLQEGILFHSLMEDEGDPYLVDALVSFPSRARLDAYLEGLRAVIDRHDILRTAVVWEGLKEPVQVVWRKAQLQIEQVALDVSEGNAAGQLCSRFDPRRYRIDVRRAPLIQACIAHDTEKDRWLMMLLMHHLIGDNTTLREMQEEIQAHLLGQTEQLPAPQPFRNLVAQARLGVSREEHEAFFRGMLGDVAEPTAPFGLLDARGDGTGMKEARSTLDRALARRIREGARKLGVSAASLFHVAWARVLASVSGREDVVFGTVLFGRMRGGAGGDRAMGLFINTLPVRIRIDEEVETSLRHTHALLADLLRHEHASLALAQRCSGVVAPTPLFSALLNYRHSGVVAHSPELVEARRVWEGIEVLYNPERTNYPFTLSVDDLGEDFAFTAQTLIPINPLRVCEYMSTAVESMARALEKAPDAAVHTLQVLPEAEWNQLLVEWNDTSAEFPRQRCLHELFEAQVERTPDGVAVVYKESHLKYADLNKQANRLAHYLRELGVKPDVQVGICIERGFPMVAAVLAVLKAGGAYVPLDPAYPAERLRWMLQDSAPTILLTQGHLRGPFSEFSETLPILDMADVAAASSDRPDTNPERTLAGPTPQNLAYVIYTSGSTGSPKGVLVEHRGVVNVIHTSISKFGVGPGSRVIQLNSLNFDASVLEIFTTLAGGGTLYLVERDVLMSSLDLGRFLEEHAITTAIVIMPSLLKLIPEGDYPALNYVITGAEECSAAIAARWSEGRFFFNAYGPTEASIYATVMLCAEREQQAPPIGRPVANVQAYILDEHWEPAPVGAVGELYISGMGVARGYLNRADLTAERFVPFPYGLAGTRMYRTGDLTKYRADGTIEFLGRNDFQVKVRGFRIELGEIETRLSEYPGVREAAVIAREDVPGEKRLVAYYITEETGEDPGVGRDPTVDVKLLRAYLLRYLPEYMVPAAYVRLEHLPLTVNGKLDRKALPAPVWGVEESQRVEPRTRAEEVLAGIWASVLGLPVVGVRENFFELGGDSIVSIQIVSRAMQAGLKFTSRQMFQYPTIEDLAAVAEVVESAGKSKVSVLEARQWSMLHPMQEWFFEQQLVEGNWWNQWIWMRVSERLDAGAMERAFAVVQEQHEALRMRFRKSEEGWRQQASPAADRGICAEVDLQGLGGEHQEAVVTTVAEQVQRSLDVEAGPVARVAIMHLGGDRGDRLLVVAHHLIVDIVSWLVIVEDLQRAYQQIRKGEAVNLAAVTTGYREWCERLAKHADSAQMNAEAEYWETALSGEIGELPVEQPEGEKLRSTQESVLVRLSPEETEEVMRDAGRAYQLQPSEVLLAAVGRVLGEWSCGAAVIVDVEGHGREELWKDADLTRTVGWFTSLYPVRLECGGEPDGMLKRVKEQLRSVPQGGLVYGALRYSGPRSLRQRMAKLPRGAASFNYVGKEGGRQGTESLMRPAEESPGGDRSPRGQRFHEIEINTGINAGGLWMSWTFSRSRYQRATIERLTSQVQQELRSLGSHCRLHGGYTPSDFARAHLTQNQLDRLMNDVAARLGVVKPLVEDIYSLSPMQQGILFHSVAAPKSGVYLVQNSSIVGAIDSAQFRQAWERLIQRHAVLRTGFEWGYDRPMQVVYRQVSLPWCEEDWRGMPASGQQRRLADLLERDRGEGFDLTKAPLMRVHIVRLGDERTQVIWSYHHLLLDGWSTTRLLEELRGIYEGLLRNEPFDLPLPRRYADYIAWLEAQKPEDAESYWRRRLAGFTSATRLLLRRSRTMDRPVRREHRAISVETTANLVATARRHRLTTNTFIDAAWAMLLSDYTGEQDVVFGATVAGRPAELAGSEAMIGLFINTLPVRVRVTPDRKLIEWLEELQKQEIEARQYGYAALERIQALSELAQGAPLLHTLVLVENYPGAVSDQASPNDPGTTTLGVFEKTNFPLALYVEPGGQIRLNLVCADSELDDAVVRSIADHFVTLITGLVDGQEGILQDVSRLSDARKAQVLTEWNRSPAAPDQVCCVHEAFEEKAARCPDAIAVECEQEHLTYRELNQRANRLAHHLRRRGVGPECLVVVCMDNSPELIAGILGVLKAGGAYVPLDPAYPPERIAHIIQDSRASAVVSKREFSPAIPSGSAGLICMDADEPWLQTESIDAPRRSVFLDNLIYAVYTSGSTGRPKGAAVAHRNFRNLMDWYIGAFGMNAADRPLLISSPSFDLTQKGIFAPLMLGGTLHLNRQPHFAPREIVANIDRAGISVLTCAPTRMYELVNALDEDAPDSMGSVRLVCLGGEPVDTRRLKPWAARPGFRASLINAFGPAETTDISNWHVIRKDELMLGADIPIGPALPNVAAVILDPRGKLLPPGVIGEICVTGRCVGRGYWRNPALTAERFVPNSYPELGTDRLYRTGDMGRWLESGVIECLGRRDHQIKIRGVRIELGEIEVRLREHPSVASCAVALEENDGSPQIVAYVVAAHATPVFALELRAYLRNYLPEQMVPAEFIPMTALPINAHGKLDRLALHRPPGRSLNLSPVIHETLAETEQERRLVKLWELVLRRKPIGVLDSFFELGGNSLSALSLVSRIEMEFGREIPITTLLAARTIRALAPALTLLDGTSIPSLQPIQPDGSRRPLYCVHPGSGNVFCYHELAAALGPDQPVFGFQDPNMNRDDYRHSSVEGLAAIYVDALRNFQPHGPYNILGWSFGGHVAFEMARCLEQQGEDVHVLAMLDTWAAPQFRLTRAATDSASLLEVIGRDFGLNIRKEQIQHLEPEAQIEFLIEIGKQAGIDYQADPRRFVRKSMRIFRARVRAVADYYPGPYPGVITVFRAADDDGEMPESADLATLGWGELCPGRVDLLQVPGTHGTLARAPHVHVVAGHLRTLLEKPLHRSSPSGAETKIANLTAASI